MDIYLDASCVVVFGQVPVAVEVPDAEAPRAASVSNRLSAALEQLKTQPGRHAHSVRLLLGGQLAMLTHKPAISGLNDFDSAEAALRLTGGAGKAGHLPQWPLVGQQWPVLEVPGDLVTRLGETLVNHGLAATSIKPWWSTVKQAQRVSAAMLDREVITWWRRGLDQQISECHSAVLPSDAAHRRALLARVEAGGALSWWRALPQLPYGVRFADCLTTEGDIFANNIA